MRWSEKWKTTGIKNTAMENSGEENF
uniref:Uncharacterized protein n=1 Tax=Arundo donax TaxID=35708 RepID=A0A0A8YJQ9_ARUDO